MFRRSTDSLGETLHCPLEFPGRLADQAQAVRRVLRDAGRLLRTNDIVAHFRSVHGDRVEELVEMLVELGQARQLGEQVVAFAA